VVSIVGAGTPEVVWGPFLAGLPPYGLPAGPVTLIAPHPDDEVLAAGGLLARLVAAGTDVRVVSVTDGEASNPGGSVPPQELAARRVAETATALARLGVTRRTRLRRPDGGADTLEAPVAGLLLPLGGTVLAPWAGDGHPDHEAVGRGAAVAAARAGAVLVDYPVWTWHWATPDDPTVPWSRARRLDLAEDVRNAKSRALSEFHSQIAPLGPRTEDAPVLPPHVLARFTRPYEVFFA
jgi:LmbE family N-acetylglucosaminyl deacetylase